MPDAASMAVARLWDRPVTPRLFREILEQRLSFRCHVVFIVLGVVASPLFVSKLLLVVGAAPLLARWILVYTVNPSPEEQETQVQESGRFVSLLGVATYVVGVVMVWHGQEPAVLSGVVVLVGGVALFLVGASDQRVYDAAAGGAVRALHVVVSAAILLACLFSAFLGIFVAIFDCGSPLFKQSLVGAVMPMLSIAIAGRDLYARRTGRILAWIVFASSILLPVSLKPLPARSCWGWVNPLGLL